MALDSKPPLKSRSFVIAADNPAPPGGEIGWLTASDGAALRYACWRSGDNVRGTVILLPGRTEFIEKYFETVGELLDRGFAVAVIDLRGQGLSSRALSDRLKGHVDDFQTYVDDIRLWIDSRLLSEMPQPFIMMGHSMGAHIGLRYLHDNPHAVQCAIFTALMTMIQTWPLSRSLALKVMRLSSRFLGDGAVILSGSRANPFAARFEVNKLTHDRERFERMQSIILQERDLAIGPPTVGWLSAAIDSMELIGGEAYLASIETPILLGIAGGDRIVDIDSQHRLAGLLPDAEAFTVPGSHHEILMETSERRAIFWQRFDDFVKRQSGA